MTTVAEAPPLLGEYANDHLVLLIGANPLPNYVAARLLARLDTCIYLVASQATAHQRRLLRAQLEDCGHHQFVELTVEEANPSHVFNTLTGALKALKGHVGLHYTGGTKAMAVHAYRAIEQLTVPTSYNPQPLAHVQFSYLDARSLRLQIQGTGISGVQSIAVGLALDVALDDLLRLHDKFTLRQAMRRQAIWRPVTLELARMHERFGSTRTWREWSEKYLRSATDRAKFRGQSDIGGITTEDLPSRIRAAFEQIYPGELPLTFGELAARTHFGVADEELARWLDGCWLEDFVFWQLTDLAPKLQLHDPTITINPLIGTATYPRSGRTNFEFDVACMRGYQLFAISCTTSVERARCKSRLLEAVVRAEQLGGAEARVGLVCCWDEPASLQEEVVELLGERVQVFGRPDLPRLQVVLADWIRRAGSGK